ncbi:hypothetical protein, partial [Novosphingobium piscinae]|uniref:hypothetical protein n=1 Tax=Novosphingobium piscinae TaxID=1507448 RepID=UPI001C8C4CA0
ALPGPVAPPPAPVPAPPPAAAPVPAAPLVGGFSPVRRGAPELGPVVKAAVAHLTPARHARARLLMAERQVVAGSHYRLLLKLRDGSVWRVMVWQRLDRSLQITEAVRTLS